MLGEARGLVVTVSLLVPPVQCSSELVLYTYYIRGRCSLSIAHRESLDPDLKQDLKIRPAGVPFIFSALLVEFAEMSGLLTLAVELVKPWPGLESWF